MFFVYAIQNPKKQWYTGMTNNVKRRLREHNSDQTYTTKRMHGPWQLIYCEISLHEFDARKREKFLKTVHGKEFLKDRLKFFLKESVLRP